MHIRYQAPKCKLKCVSLYTCCCCCFLMNAHIIEAKKRDPNNDMRMVERKERSRIRCASQNCESISGRRATFFSPRRLEKLAWIVFHQSPRQKKAKREINNYESDVCAKWVFRRALECGRSDVCARRNSCLRLMNEIWNASAWNCIQRRCDISFPSRRMRLVALFRCRWFLWRVRDMKNEERLQPSKINFLVAFEAARRGSIRWIMNSRVSRFMSLCNGFPERLRRRWKTDKKRETKQRRNYSDAEISIGRCENMQTIKNYVCPASRESEPHFYPPTVEYTRAHCTKKQKPFKSLCSLITKFDYRRFCFSSPPARKHFPSSIPLCRETKELFINGDFLYSSWNNQTRHPSHPLQSSPPNEIFILAFESFPRKKMNSIVINVKRSRATASDLHILPRSTPAFFNYFVHAENPVLLIFHNLFPLFLIDIKGPSGRWKSVYSYGLLSVFWLSERKRVETGWNGAFLR